MMQGVYAVPRVTLEANGQTLSPASVQMLEEVRVQQRLSMPAMCELTFRHPPGSPDVAARLERGAALVVRVGEGAGELFSGQVTVHETVYGPAAGQQLIVRAYDLLHRLRKRQPVRAHVQVTLRDLAQELVGDLGLDVAADDSGPLWPILIQHGQSDLEILAEVAAESGVYLVLRGRTLHLVTLEGADWGRGDAASLALGRNLLEARFVVSGESATRSVTAQGWNPLIAEAYEGRAEAAGATRQVEPGVVGGTGERALVGEVALDNRHAEAIARGELERRVAGGITFWGVAEGNAELQPGTRVEVSNVAEELQRRYVLTAVTHTLDHVRGYVSELSSAPIVPEGKDGQGCGPAAIALGRVTRVDDPDHLGRVRVSLPTYGEVETEWMHVLSAGAGANKGLTILPDVEDRVLVLFTHGDPGQGVVLGGLYGMQGAPDSGVEGRAVRRYTLLTPGGQRITLDDAQQTARIENSDGSYVELSPQVVRVHADTDLHLEAPGREVLIRGQKINFERA